MRRFAVRLVATVAWAAAASGCVVPAARYDQASSSLRVEQSSHRRTLRQLHQAHAELQSAQARSARVQARERQTQARLEELQQLAAQTELDASLVAQEREEAARLVEQLRGELERVGEHLRSYADDRAALGQALERAQERVARLVEIERNVAFRALVVRDLTLALHEPLATGEYALLVEEGQVVLQVPATRVFINDTTALHPETVRLFAALAAVVMRHGSGRIAITELGSIVRTQRELAVRLRSVLHGLTDQGLAEASVTIAIPDPSPTAAQSADTVLDPVSDASSEPPKSTVAFAISAV
jgi:hypothetical protein